MIELPDFSKNWEYENGFYLTCDNSRFSKFLAHYELFKMTQEVSGAIVECGIFKGASFIRFAAFRDLFLQTEKPLIGFDTFGAFPEPRFEADKDYVQKWKKAVVEESISKEQLFEVLAKKRVMQNIDLVEGDVQQTIPTYLEEHPNLHISLLNLDTDIYEPAVVILEHLWPRIVSGGILILDDYGTFPGETQAVDGYFQGKVEIRKFPFAKTPSYIVKR